MTWRGAAWGVVVGVVVALNGPAWAEEQVAAGADSSAVTPVDVAAAVATMECDELEDVFHVEVPSLVYDDRPDGLYEFIVAVEDRCDLGEPMGRTRILASIWDGVFDEAAYGFAVVDWLAERWSSSRQPADGSAAALFDAFTVDFANQLLPHQESGSLEEFFCLFYSGRRDEAWALLQGEALEDTWLRYYYDEEVSYLESKDPPYLVTAYWGRWFPGGKADFVGSKTVVGGMVEQWKGNWFMRLAIEGRIGRAGAPYFVNKDGVSGYSDRWDGLLLALESGIGTWKGARHQGEAFIGVGWDGVVPFRGVDMALDAFNLGVGVGWRFGLDAASRWFVRLDGRAEWVSERNDGGTAMGGFGAEFRLGLGLTLGSSPEPRLRALGRAGD